MKSTSSSRLLTRVGVAVLLAAIVLASGNASASSHREAPAIATNPVADNTDTYFFVSPMNPNNVVIVGCWWPLEEPSGGPNWFHFGEDTDYTFNIDNDGDALVDIAYVFRFRTQFTNPATSLYATGAITSLTDPNWNYRQTYSVTRIENGHLPGAKIADNLVVPPVNIGPRTTPDYTALVNDAQYTVGSGIKVFAGQRDDPFFVDLGAVFDLLAFRAIPGDMGEGVDGLGGFNCQSIVMEVPISQITRDGSNPKDPGSAAAVVGLWATSAAPARAATPATVDGAGASTAGPRRQVSRLGMPLVNEVVIPIGRKDAWNASYPKDDAQFLSYVTDPELAQKIEAIYGIPRPPTPRCDLVAIFLTGIPGLNQPPSVVPSEEMRLNVAIKPDMVPDSRLGLLGGDNDGFPNGRRLADDVVDIEERCVEGVVYTLLCGGSYTPHELAGRLGDGVDVNDMPFLDSFPYVATPHEGFEHEHHRVEPPHGGGMAADGVTLGAAAGAAIRGARSAGTGETGEEAVFDLGRAYPNPTVSSTDIRFSLARESQVSLKVFDVTGREVATLADGVMAAGAHSARWNGTDARGAAVAPGIYFYRLETPSGQMDKKLTVLK